MIYVHVIPPYQYMMMIIAFVTGSTTLVFVGGAAEQDAWIAIILGLVEAFGILLPYGILTTRFPGIGLSKINDQVWGRYAGKVITLLFVWYTWNLCSVVMTNGVDFVQSTLLDRIPDKAVDFANGLIITVFVLSGIECIGRFTSISIVPAVSFALFVTLLSIPNIDPNNIRPILATPIPILMKASHSLAVFPFGEVVIFFAIAPFLRNPKQVMKHTAVAMIVGALLVLVFTLRNTFVLGKAASFFSYPSYTVAKSINVAGVFSRMEILVALVLILSAGLKIIYLLFASSVTLAEMIGVNTRTVAIPLGILAAFLRPWNFASIPQNYQYAEKIYSVYALLFQFIIPLVTLAVALTIRRKTTICSTPNKSES